jgi:hypothetical protein
MEETKTRKNNKVKAVVQRVITACRVCVLCLGTLKATAEYYLNASFDT